MEALLAVINKISDPTILVLLLVCAGMGFLMWQHSKYDREDRDKLITSLGAIKDAIVETKLAFSKEFSDFKVFMATRTDK